MLAHHSRVDRGTRSTVGAVVSAADADGISVTNDEGSTDAMIEENSVDGTTTEASTGGPLTGANSALDGATRAVVAEGANATLVVVDVATISTIVEDSIGARVEQGTVSAAAPDSNDVSATGALVGAMKVKVKALAVSAISAVVETAISVVVETAISVVEETAISVVAASATLAVVVVANLAVAASESSAAEETEILAAEETAISAAAASATLAVAAVAKISAIAVAAEERVLTIEEDSIEGTIQDLTGAIVIAETLARDGARMKTEVAAVVVISIPTTGHLDALSIVGKSDRHMISRVIDRAPDARVSTIDVSEETLRRASPIETPPPRRVPLAEPTMFKSGVRATTPTMNEYRTASIASIFTSIDAERAITFFPSPRRRAGSPPTRDLARHTSAHRARAGPHRFSPPSARDVCAASPRARAPPRARATGRA